MRPELSEAYASLGGVHFWYDWDPLAAERAFRRAIELNPNYATAHAWYGLLLGSTARHQEALAQLERARRLDPLSPVIILQAANVRIMNEDFEGALREIREAIEFDPDFPTTLHFMVGTAAGVLRPASGRGPLPGGSRDGGDEARGGRRRVREVSARRARLPSGPGHRRHLLPEGRVP